jgi:hypothetical protein
VTVWSTPSTPLLSVSYDALRSRPLSLSSSNHIHHHHQRSNISSTTGNTIVVPLKNLTS